MMPVENIRASAPSRSTKIRPGLIGVADVVRDVFSSPRTLPIAIACFLILLVVNRIFALTSEYERIKSDGAAVIESIDSQLHSALTMALQEQSATAEVKDLKALAIKTVAKQAPADIAKTGRVILVSNEKGTIIATIPEGGSLEGQNINSLIGENTALAIFGARAGVVEIKLPDGVTAFAAHRKLPAPLGAVTVYQRSDVMLGGFWWHVLANCGWVLGSLILLLGLQNAYHRQKVLSGFAEQSYNETQCRMDAAMARGRCGLWDWDLRRGNIFWSQSMLDLLGYSSQDSLLSFEEVCQLMHPDDGHLYAMAEAVTNGQTLVMDQEFRMRHADGNWIWLHVRAELSEGADGGHHLIGIAMDISQTKEIEEKSRLADRRFHDAINSTTEAFVLWDKNHRLVRCNNRFKEIYQLEDQHIATGSKMADVMAHCPFELDTKQMLNVGNAGQEVETYEARLHDDRWLQINISRTADGGYVSVGADITDLKRNQAKLEAQEKRLRSTVNDLHRERGKAKHQAAKNRELADRLAVEKTNAEAANLAKSNFLASMSHELRTPLNAILGFSEVFTTQMFGKLGNEKYEEYARDIHNSGKFLLHVINDVLDMSKIEAGKFELSNEELSLCDIIGESVRMIAGTAEAQNINITADVADQIALLGDRRAVKQVLLNLLSNAVKFNNSGGNIWVSARHTGSEVVVSIKDNGIGIDKEILPRLCQPFEQAKHSMTRDHDGSGLGLAISKRLVEMHEGMLDIKSKIGEGTCVTLHFPAGNMNMPQKADNSSTNSKLRLVS